MKTTIQKLTKLLQEQFNNENTYLEDFKFIFESSLSIDEIGHHDVRVINLNGFEIITKREYNTIYFNILRIGADAFISRKNFITK